MGASGRESRKRWPKDKLVRALLDLRQGFGYYRRELRAKREPTTWS
jgi:hypothetical protein